jgi:hypothetical protein
MTDKEIEEVYQIIKDYHEKYLKKHGVKLPKLKDAYGNYVKDALVLVYLARFYPSTVSVMKDELTEFVRKFYPKINDVQQARHLGAQKGWFISAGGRDNVHIHKLGEYRLITLERPYPHFKGHRIETTGDWGIIKQQYGNRCATCGSEEGKRNLQYPNTITKLQKSHIDPFKPLTEGNIFPQCQKCNRAYRNFWVFDERGRIRGIANPAIIKKCKEEIKRKIYKILYNEYKGANPNEQ